MAEERGDEDDEHLGEVPGQQVVEELLDIGRDPAALLDGGDDRREVVVQQDHVRCVAGDVGASQAHRDADVGALERGRVVHAVAGHDDDVVPLAERAEDAELVARLDAGEDAGPLDDRVIVELLELASLDRIGLEADVTCDRGRGDRVVAGDHHDPDAGLGRGAQGRCGLRPRRVGDPGQAEEHEVALDVVARCRRGRLAGQRQDAERVARHARGGFEDPLAIRRLERPDLAVLQDARASRHDHLRSALGNHLDPAVGRHDDAHPFALRRERDLLEALRVLDVDAGLLRRHEQGDLGRVAGDAAVRGRVGVVAQRRGAEDGCVVQVDWPSVVEELAGRVVAGATGDLDVAPIGPQAADAHPALGDRAGLVGAHHVGGTENLDDGEGAYERVAPEHAARAEGECQGHDHRQALRDGGDRQGHGGDERLERVAASEGELEDGDPDDEEADDECDLPPELPDLALERGRPLLNALDRLGDGADLGRHAGAGDDEPAPARRDGGAHERHVRALGEGRVGGERVGRLVHRHALTGERRLVDPEVVGLHDATVGRDAVALLEDDEVARHELVSPDPAQLPVAHDARLRHRQPAQRVDTALGAVVLDEPEQAVEDDDGGDEPRVAPVVLGRVEQADHREDDDRADQDEDERVAHLVEQQPPRRRRGTLGEGVRADPRQALGGLMGSQAARARAERGQDVVDRACVRIGESEVGVHRWAHHRRRVQCIGAANRPMRHGPSGGNEPAGDALAGRSATGGWYVPSGRDHDPWPDLDGLILGAHDHPVTCPRARSGGADGTPARGHSALPASAWIGLNRLEAGAMPVVAMHAQLHGRRDAPHVPLFRRLHRHGHGLRRHAPRGGTRPRRHEPVKRAGRRVR